MKCLTKEMVTRKAKSYHVYLLLCENGSYYTGYTNDPASRFAQHKSGRGAQYTKMHRPKNIVYLERYRTRGTAMRRERQIKALSHDEKRELVRKASRIARNL